MREHWLKTWASFTFVYTGQLLHGELYPLRRHCGSRTAADAGIALSPQGLKGHSAQEGSSGCPECSSSSKSIAQELMEESLCQFSSFTSSLSLMFLCSMTVNRWKPIISSLPLFPHHCHSAQHFIVDESCRLNDNEVMIYILVLLVIILIMLLVVGWLLPCDCSWRPECGPQCALGSLAQWRSCIPSV